MSEDTNTSPEDDHYPSVQRGIIQHLLTRDTVDSSTWQSLLETLFPSQIAKESDPEWGGSLSPPHQGRQNYTAAVSRFSPTNEAVTICPICRDTLDNLAIIKPCDHSDFKCLRTWLAQPSRRSRTCPLCRRVIEEVHHNFDAEGLFNVQVLERLEEQDGLPDDEQIMPNMPARERHAALERHRLRARRHLVLRSAAEYINI